MNNDKIINNFLQSKRVDGASENTLYVYSKSLNILLKWCRTNRKHLSLLNLQDAEEYKLYLSTRKGKGNQPLSSTSRQYHTTVLKGVVSYMRKNNINLLHERDVLLNKAEKKPDHIWTDAQVDRIRQAMGNVSRNPLREKALFEVLVQTGMRIGELLALNRDTIEQAIQEQRQENRDYIELSIVGKSKKPRVITIYGIALVALTQYLEKRHDLNPALFATATETGRLDNRYVGTVFKRAGKLAGVEHFTAHQARHYLGMRLARKGYNQTIIRDILGHENTATTDRYVRIANNDLRKAVMDLD